MKHVDLMTDQDRADIERAAQMIEDGKKLRVRTCARLRARAFRKARKDEHAEG